MEFFTHWLFKNDHILKNYGLFFSINNFKTPPPYIFNIKNVVSKKLYYSLNLNQSKSTDYQWNLTDSNS